MSYNLSVSDDSSFNLDIPETIAADTTDYQSLFELPFSPLYDSSFDIPEMISTDKIDYQSLLDLPFSPLYDSSSDYNLQASLNSNQVQQNQVNESTCSDQLVSGFLLSSPQTDQLENLSPYQTTQFPSQSVGPNFGNKHENFNCLNYLEVKTEECKADGHSDVNENVTNYLQRSFSSKSFEGKPNFSSQTPFDSLMESQNFQGQAMNMPENSFLTGQTRKACCTGDLQNVRNVHTNQGLISTPSAIKNSFMEKTSFKVGRYTPEERQERISKYRDKRKLRNFNKTIKYACRKTLADNRRRERGRFARNDETVEIPKGAT